MDHDHAFKNLILDYPRQALAFFAAPEGDRIPAAARITPVRQEQLQERLGERFRELDTPLLVEWPNGERGGLVFVVEEETQPHRFSVHRLIHYCVDLSELLATTRVVPVVIFLRRGRFATVFQLTGDCETYLEFRFLHCHLAQLLAREYRQSENIVARLNLLNMTYEPEEKLGLYLSAQEGLATLESNPNKQRKYAGFIDAYAALTEAEEAMYRRDYLAQSAQQETIMGFMDRIHERGRQEGLQEGMTQLLQMQLERRFGELSSAIRHRLEVATQEQRLRWAQQLLEAKSIDELFDDEDKP